MRGPARKAIHQADCRPLPAQPVSAALRSARWMDFWVEGSGAICHSSGPPARASIQIPRKGSRSGGKVISTA